MVADRSYKTRGTVWRWLQTIRFGAVIDKGVVFSHRTASLFGTLHQVNSKAVARALLLTTKSMEVTCSVRITTVTAFWFVVRTALLCGDSGPTAVNVESSM